VKTTVIISVYKDTESLALILKSIANQSLTPFEILVSEDGNSEEMKTFLTQHKNVKHTFQEDNGWQKNKALNNAVKMFLVII
jgi:glycosyltransferase involved in cell wall biosynthesis